VDEAVLLELRERIKRTRWPNRVTGAGWDAGTDPEYVRSLLATWADEFDWRRRERELNRLAHYRANIDGVRIHFVHERGNGPAPVPIVLTHGFPSSFQFVSSSGHCDPPLDDLRVEHRDVVGGNLSGRPYSGSPPCPPSAGWRGSVGCRTIRTS
jgi:hypothetical protein